MATRIPFSEWDGALTFETEAKGLDIMIRHTTGEHDFHGLPRYVCHSGKRGTEPVTFTADSRDELADEVIRLYSIDIMSLVGSVS